LFAERGQNEIKYNPHIFTYRLIVRAYVFLNEFERACSIAQEGQAIYPTDITMKKNLVLC